MTLYVVTEGEYSVYHIIGIYSTKELAEKVKKYYSGIYKYPDIEEWELDANMPEDIDDIREYYRIDYDRRQYGEGRWECHKFTKHGKDKSKDCPWYLSKSWGYPFRIDIPCDIVKDENQAIKIAQDKRMELIAMEEGV